jgi:hypothetical protein
VEREIVLVEATEQDGAEVERSDSVVDILEPNVLFEQREGMLGECWCQILNMH